MICSTIICTKCKKPKPSTEFKRLLSRAQAKAKGYAGNHRVEVETSLCKLCQPKPTPFTRMSKRALGNAVAAGDISQLMMNLILQEREANRGVNAARKTKERWHEAYSTAWRDVVAKLSKEVYHIRDQQKHAKMTGHVSRLNYANTYLDVLNKLRARLRIKAAKPDAAPHSIYWQDHTTPDEVDKVRVAWIEIPFELRTKGRGMRQPLILTHRTLPADQVKPVVRLANGGETLDNPAARLAQGEDYYDPYAHMTDAQLEHMSAYGQIPSPIVNAVLQERRKLRDAEALGRADAAYKKEAAKRTARAVTEAKKLTKQEKIQRGWSKKLQPVARPPAPEPMAMPDDPNRESAATRLAKYGNPSATIPEPEQTTPLRGTDAHWWNDDI